MSTTLDLGAAPATPKPRCTDAAWCIGHVLPGDTVHLSAATTTHGLPLWLRRTGDGPTFVTRGRTGHTIHLSPAQTQDVIDVLVGLATTADLDNKARGISADTGTEA